MSKVQKYKLGEAIFTYSHKTSDHVYVWISPHCNRALFESELIEAGATPLIEPEEEMLEEDLLRIALRIKNDSSGVVDLYRLTSLLSEYAVAINALKKGQNV